MKRYLIVTAIAVTLTSTVFAAQPENTAESHAPLTAQPDYQNVVRAWSAGLGFDVAGVLDGGPPPSAQSERLAGAEPTVTLAPTGQPGEDPDDDEDEAAGDPGTRESS